MVSVSPVDLGNCFIYPKVPFRLLLMTLECIYIFLFIFPRRSGEWMELFCGEEGSPPPPKKKANRITTLNYFMLSWTYIQHAQPFLHDQGIHVASSTSGPDNFLRLPWTHGPQQETLNNDGWKTIGSGCDGIFSWCKLLLLAGSWELLLGPKDMALPGLFSVNPQPFHQELSNHQ